MDNRLYNRMRTRLNAGYLLVVLALAHAPLHLSGLLLVLAGESLRTWSAGILQKGRTLTTGGPYRFTRNPLYLGSLLTAAGYALAIGNYWLLLAMLTGFLPLYHGMVKRGERELMSSYGETYRRYMEAVPRYLSPRCSPKSIPPGSASFSWRGVIHNREHATWLALAVFTGLLVARSFLLR